MPTNSPRQRAGQPKKSRWMIAGIGASVVIFCAAFIVYGVTWRASESKRSRILSHELDRLQLPIPGAYSDGELGPGFCEKPCTKLDRVYHRPSAELDSVRDAIIQNLKSNGYHNITNLKQTVSAERGDFSITIYSEKVTPSRSIDIYLSVLN